MQCFLTTIVLLHGFSLLPDNDKDFISGSGLPSFLVSSYLMKNFKHFIVKVTGHPQVP